jgi:hypothetical protein
MNGARNWELAAMAAIAVLVALGGKSLLVSLGHVKPLGIALAAGALVAALGSLRRAYEGSPGDPLPNPDARADVTRGGAYVAAAIFALWAIIAPGKWVYGACLVAAESAIVFDLIATVARGRAAKGS